MHFETKMDGGLTDRYMDRKTEAKHDSDDTIILCRYQVVGYKSY